jgi:hypothetical protein
LFAWNALLEQTNEPPKRKKKDGIESNRGCWFTEHGCMDRRGGKVIPLLQDKGFNVSASSILAAESTRSASAKA